MKRYVLPLVALTLVAAFAFWWFSPVQMLQRRTRAFLHAITLQSGAGKASRQMGVYSISPMLASQVELVTPAIPEANGTFDRSEMESAFAWLCEQAKQTRFELQHIHSVKVAGDQADVVFSLNALVELPETRPVDGRFNVTFHWQREDDGWRLARADWMEAKP